jgi:hypothetical protein
VRLAGVTPTEKPALPAKPVSLVWVERGAHCSKKCQTAYARTNAPMASEANCSPAFRGIGDHASADGEEDRNAEEAILSNRRQRGIAT